MEEKDKKIINLLRKNSRTRLNEISKEIEMPISTVYKKIINNKHIKRYYSIVDFAKTGYALRAFMFIRTKDENIGIIAEGKCINNLLKLKGEYDYFLDCVFQNFAELYNFLDEIAKLEIEDIKKHIILEIIKEECFEIE